MVLHAGGVKIFDRPPGCPTEEVRSLSNSSHALDPPADSAGGADTYLSPAMALRRVALGVARRVLAPVEAGIFTESAHARHHSRCVRFCSSTGGSGRDDEDGEPTDDPAAGSDPEVRSPAWNVPDDAPAPETDATASTADDDAEIATTSSSNEHSTNKKNPFVPFFVRKAGETDSNAAAPSKQRGAAARRKPTTAPPDESQNLYVKNLPPDFSAAKLANLFLQHGDVLSTKFVAAEPTAGRPAPTGLVRFATRAEAEAAMAQLNGVKLGGDGVGPATEPLEVSVAMSKEQREAQYAERKAAREERMEKRKAWLAKQAEWAQKMKERDARRAAFANRVSIHVRDAPRGLDAESTAKIFKPFGDVARVKLWFANGASPTAVLSMGSAEEAAAAIAMLSGRKLEGCAKPMTITVHKPGNKGDGKAKDASPNESESESESESAAAAAPPGPELPIVDVDDEMLAKQKAAMDAAATIAAEVRASRPTKRTERRPLSPSSPSERRPLSQSREREPSTRARAYGGERGRARTTSQRGEAVAGPGVAITDARAMERLESATARMRQRGAGRAFGAGLNDAFTRQSKGGTGGGDRSKKGPARRRAARDAFGMGAIDPKTQAALDARVREAREAARGEVNYDWDVGEFEQTMRMEFDENWNAAEFNAAPYVPGFNIPPPGASKEDEGSVLDAHKDWLMRVGNIPNDEVFNESKRVALEQFQHYKRMDEKERVRAGASPISGDFLAERASLTEEVDGISSDSPMYAFAVKAVDALDGNAGWSHDRKIRALRFLASRAEKYGAAEETGATQVEQ